jgi:hypothetical protein
MASIHHSQTASVPLLRLLPVLSSTASVTFCFTEYWTLIPFLQASIPPRSLSSFWSSYLYTTIPGWVGFGLLSASTGFLGWRNTTGTTKSLYGWGTVLALGHYVFGPMVCKLRSWHPLCLFELRYFGGEDARGYEKRWEIRELLTVLLNTGRQDH